MTARRPLGLIRALVLLMAGLPWWGAARAVTDEEIFRDFRFNLDNPGARSLGLGRAFIALADDATASVANPGGLTQLVRPEFSIELRYSDVDDSLTQDDPGPLVVEARTEPDDLLSPSFLSYVYPWKRAAVGLSRMELNRASNVTFDQVGAVGSMGSRTANAEGQIDTDLSVWNLTGALRLGDRLAIGATMAFGSLEIRSQVFNTLTDTAGVIIPPGSTIASELFTTRIDDQDTDITFNAGIHWQPVDSLSFGAVYRGGFEFVVDESLQDEQGLVPFSTFFLGFPLTISNALGSSVLETNFNTPASYGAGVAWRPGSRLTLTADWVHVNYEDLLDGFQGGLNVLTLGDFEARFVAESADNYHLGAEYLLMAARRTPIALRAGYFTDRPGTIFADFDKTRLPNGVVLPRGQSSLSTNDTFPEPDREQNFTLGAGIALEGRFQIDAAAALGTEKTTLVVSVIVGF